MRALCPICNSPMDSNMFCRKCSLQIDRVKRSSYFVGPHGDAIRETLSCIEELSDPDTYTQKEVFGRPVHNYAGILSDCFKRRLSQVLSIGSSYSALSCKMLSAGLEKYLFQRWCLINAAPISKDMYTVMQLICSPTLEEMANRIWKIFDVELHTRTEEEMLYGFAVSFNRREPDFTTGDKILKYYEETLIPFIMSKTMGVKTSMVSVVGLGKDVLKLQLDSSPTFSVNEGVSHYDAFDAQYVNMPFAISFGEFKKLEEEAKEAKRLSEYTMPGSYVKDFGIEAKRKLLSNWSVSYGEEDDVVLVFWKEVAKRVLNGKFEKR